MSDMTINSAAMRGSNLLTVLPNFAATALMLVLAGVWIGPLLLIV